MAEMLETDALPAMLQEHHVVDLSQPMEVGMPSFPTQSRYFHELWNSYWHGETSVSYQIIMNEHSGTHVDAPAHSIADGRPNHTWVDAIPLESLIGRAATVDVHGLPSNSFFDIEVMESFQEAHGPLVEGDIVLYNTGWASKWALRPEFGPYLHGWPAPTPELCEWLVKHGVKAVGCDNMALDAPGSKDFPAHAILLGNGVPILENLTNIDALPPFCTFVALPLKIASGSGSPLRPVAFVPKGRHD